MNDAELVRLVDQLEDSTADSFVTLEQVEAAAAGDVTSAISDGLLLVDYRTRLDGSRVTLCRLNRRHPLVVELTRW